VNDLKEGPQSLNADTCNPLGQAAVLNQFGSELNILVGINLGMDCIFTTASEAPVTTLFVKDRMLANNPIGAIYSDYYLSEIARHADIHETIRPNPAESSGFSVS
jgi:uncharacterized metal-binding protein